MHDRQSPALALVPQTADHAPDMFDLLQDPAIYLHENEPPESLEWLRTRFRKLESRASPDGKQKWLNWVISVPPGELAGYVQATVYPDGRAAIAYVLGSRYWGRGLATAAVEAMVRELRTDHGVHNLSAVLKKTNTRSLRLLERMKFNPAPAELHAAYDVEPDELLLLRRIEG
jgi:[ribosomal protein S5]-alanine N-acetyltransferase